MCVVCLIFIAPNDLSFVIHRLRFTLSRSSYGVPFEWDLL